MGRLWRLVPAVAAALVLLPLSPVRPAHAAPACGSPPAGGTPLTEVPWPQQRYGLERLAGLADGTGVLVAVVDSGVDAAHPQLTGAVVAGLDLLDPGGDGRLDCVGHGTAVASIVAGRARTGQPFRGVAPGATVLPVRVSERVDGAENGTARAASVPAVAGALRQAVDRGARVVNLSLTTDRDDPTLREAVRYARSRDVLLVAAAGNRHESGNPVVYPAAYDGVIGVGAVQPDGRRTPQSQTGAHVDLVAPGAEVAAAGRGGSHSRYTGTSFAAAFVTGTAALVRQYRPGLTEAEVADRLTVTADTVTGFGPGGEYGAGIVNPYRAVTAVLDARSTAPSPPAVGDGTPDPAALAAAKVTADTRATAYRLALAGALTLALLTVAASALPRAARRRWRAG